jgi:NTE family protein
MFRLFRKRPKRLGLTLSGGGSRGLAHIGVLKVLEREHIPIHCLSGSSMGGIIAAAYACGITVEELEREAIRMGSVRELAKLVDLRPPRRGLLAGENVRDYLAQLIPEGITFDQLKIPTALKAVDLHSGTEVDFTEGLVLDAVVATSAFPGIFPPFEHDGKYLVDGGVLNNLPVDLLKRLGANCTLAINVSPTFDGAASDPPPSVAKLPIFAFDIYLTILLMTRTLTERRLERRPPDLLIEPNIPLTYGLFSGFSQPGEVVSIGEKAAEASLDRIRNLLD